MYIVRPSAGLAGSLSVTNDALFSTITSNIVDKTVRFEAAPAPSVSAPGTGSIDYNGANNRFEVSENAGAYRPIGDVTSVAAPGISADKIASFQLATGKVIQETNIGIDAARNSFVFPDNIRQTFNPGANVAGLNVGVQTPDPTAAVGGDLWYNALNSRLMTNAGGITQPVGNMVADGVYSPAARRIIYEASAPFNTARATVAINATNDAFSYATDTRQTFAPGATSAGVNVGSVAPDPSGAINGDLWYNSATNQLMATINGVNVALGVPTPLPPGTPRALPPFTTVVLSPGGLFDFTNYTIPANTLRSDGDYFRYSIYGQLFSTGSDTLRSVNARIGGFTPTINFGSLVVNSNSASPVNWIVSGIGLRVSSTLFRFIGQITFGFILEGAGTMPASTSGQIFGGQSFDYTVTPAFYTTDQQLIPGSDAHDAASAPVPNVLNMNALTCEVYNF
jgi:hypothetical protein